MRAIRRHPNSPSSVASVACAELIEALLGRSPGRLLHLTLVREMTVETPVHPLPNFDDVVEHRLHLGAGPEHVGLGEVPGDAVQRFDFRHAVERARRGAAFGRRRLRLREREDELIRNAASAFSPAMTPSVSITSVAWSSSPSPVSVRTCQEETCCFLPRRMWSLMLTTKSPPGSSTRTASVHRRTWKSRYLGPHCNAPELSGWRSRPSRCL